MKIIKSLVIVLIFSAANVFSQSCDDLANELVPYVNSYVNNTYYGLQNGFAPAAKLPSTCAGLGKQLKDLKSKIMEFNNNHNCKFDSYPSLNPSVSGAPNAVGSLSNLLGFYAMLNPAGSNSLCSFPSSDTSLPSAPVAKLPAAPSVQPTTQPTTQSTTTQQPATQQQPTSASTCSQLAKSMIPYLELMVGFTSQPGDFSCSGFVKDGKNLKEQNQDLTLIANLFYTKGCKLTELTGLFQTVVNAEETYLYAEGTPLQTALDNIFDSEFPFTLDNFLVVYPSQVVSPSLLKKCKLPPVPDIFSPPSHVSPGTINFLNNAESAVIPLVIQGSSANIKVVYNAPKVTVSCQSLANQMIPYLELLVGLTSALPEPSSCSDLITQIQKLTSIATSFYAQSCKLTELTTLISKQPDLYQALFSSSDGDSAVFNSKNPFTLYNIIMSYYPYSGSCTIPNVPNIFQPWLIDTGWPAAGILKSLVTNLPGKRSCYTDFGSTICAKTVTIPSLQIGNSQEPDNSVVVSNIQGANADPESVLGGPGILGAGVFASSVVKFDFPNSKLYIYSRGYFEQNKGEIITKDFKQLNAIRKGSKFLVTAKINDQPVPMPDGTGKGLLIVDTGSAIVLLANRVVKSGVLTKLNNTIKEGQFTGGGGGSSGKNTTFNMYNQKLELEGKDGGPGVIQKSIPVGLPADNQSSDIGSGLSGDIGFPALKGLVMIFDYHNGNLWAKIGKQS